MSSVRGTGRLCGIVSALALAVIPSVPASAQAPANRTIERSTYAAHLRAMWQAECVANWTGLRTEGGAQGPPFLTDAAWGQNPPPPPFGVIDFVLTQDPWWADDDTDIEYVYLHLMDLHQTNRLTPDQIRDGWLTHMVWNIWVSNYWSRELMLRGVRPPMSAAAHGMLSLPGRDFAPMQALMIDAQLTTEFFGALCPGMPERALEMADLPIRATSVGYATHASQFFVVLYSLASQVDQTSPGDQQALWLVREARKYIPDTSKSADVVDFVLADYLANPDKNNWESTRDKVHLRYQANAAANGFVYQAWYESSVNFACGVMALLYGEMDFARTVQIGTLSGWDSDNGTATMGGLIGLVQGPAFRKPAYNWPALSERYWISRTRENMPDHTPLDPAAEDAFVLMAERMLPIIDREVAAAGGRVEGAGTAPATGAWLLPPGGAGDGVSRAAALSRSPTHRLQTRSANRAVRDAGGAVTGQCSVPGSPQYPYGWGDPAFIANGLEHDFRGLEEFCCLRGYCSTQRAAGNPPGVPQSFAVLYDRTVLIHTVRFIASDYFTTGAQVGGWFVGPISIEVRSNGAWSVPEIVQGPQADPARPGQILDFVLQAPTPADGVRISGLPGGAAAFVTCIELDALAPFPASTLFTFDINADARVDVEDLYAIVQQPIDLNADGASNDTDVQYLESAVRFGEARGMVAR